VRGHRPKERMPALVGESEEFLQFSAQRPFQTLASIPVMGRTELCLPHRSSPTLFQRVDPTRARMPPLKEEYEEFLQANTQRNLREKGETTLQLVQDSLSATQKRNLLLSNYSNGQKEHGDQADLVLPDQAVIFKGQKESDGGDDIQFKRTNPLDQVMMETLVETFTTQAMWLIVQAMLSLSVGHTLEAQTLMEAPTLIFLVLADLRMKISTVLAMIIKEEVIRMTERTRQIVSLSSLPRSEQMEEVKADLCQAKHSSMSTCQQAMQVFLSGAYSAGSGMDINCTMTEMARGKGTTLNNFNTGRVIEVAV